MGTVMADERLWLDLQAIARAGASVGSPVCVDQCRREDCVQDTMLHLWKAHGRGADECELRKLAYRYSRRKLYSYSTREFLMVGEAAEHSRRKPDLSGFEEIVDNGEILECVMREAEVLGIAEVLQCVLSGDTVQGYCRRNGVPRRTIRNRIEKLREKMAIYADQ